MQPAKDDMRIAEEIVYGWQKEEGKSILQMRVAEALAKCRKRENSLLRQMRFLMEENSKLLMERFK